MPVIDLVADALACYRITRLVNEDVIFDKPRDAILAWAGDGLCDAALNTEHTFSTPQRVLCIRPAGHGEIHEHRRAEIVVNWQDDDDGAEAPGQPKRTHPKIAELIQCPWCISIYAAFAIVVARRFFPRQWSPIAKALAFSGLTGFLAEKS